MVGKASGVYLYQTGRLYSTQRGHKEVIGVKSCIETYAVVIGVKSCIATYAGLVIAGWGLAFCALLENSRLGVTARGHNGSGSARLGRVYRTPIVLDLPRRVGWSYRHRPSSKTRPMTSPRAALVSLEDTPW